MRLRLLCLFVLLFSGTVSSWASAPATPLGTTASTNLFSNLIPQAITDPGTITSVINVTTADTYLWDLDLTTSITHTTNADLDITLTSPASTVVIITTDNGSTGDDIFNGSLWDDNSGSPVTDFAHLNGVTSTPLVAEGALGAFIGENPNGNWTLTITDDTAGATGSLVSWSLQVTTLNTPPNLSSNSFSNATAAAIPDSTGPEVAGVPVVSTISVSGLNNYLADVNLFTNITHSFINDLVITLTSPAGTVVTVVSRVGGSQNNVFAGTLWDDDAISLGPATDHTYINNVVATPLQPEQAMAAFIGEDPNGTWTLTVSDWFIGDTGTLNNWRLDFQTIAPTPVYDSSPLPGAALLLNTTVGIPMSGLMNITEAGTADLNLSSATYTGDPQISITTNPLPTTILDGSASIATLGLTCNSLTAGTFTGTLTINHNAFGSPATYPITCTITGSPITGGETESNEPAPEIAIFDPAISKLGFLVPGQLGALGEQLEWVISLSNPSNAAGNNVLVTDTLNANLRIDRVDAPNATVNISGQTVNVTFASIQPGQSFQFSIFTTVMAGTSVENTACVQAAGIAAECSTASPIRSLPQTGEAPLWSNLLRGLVVMLLLATGLYLLYRRRITTQ